MAVRQISIDAFHTELRAQGVSSPEHCAFVCPVCETVQSIASLKRAGASAEGAEMAIGFSCEGRFSGAGPWPSDKDRSKKANVRRSARGCDWTLGGLFRIHQLEVLTEQGPRPRFEIATPRQAAALERELADAADRSAAA